MTKPTRLEVQDNLVWVDRVPAPVIVQRAVTRGDIELPADAPTKESLERERAYIERQQAGKVKAKEWRRNGNDGEDT